MRLGAPRGDAADRWDVCAPQANVNGRVLSQCNIDELKKEMNMNFGDWQLFRATVSQCHFLLTSDPKPTHPPSSSPGSQHATNGESAAAGGSCQ